MSFSHGNSIDVVKTFVKKVLQQAHLTVSRLYIQVTLTSPGRFGKHNATPNELLELCLSLLLRDNLETQLGGLFP
jgi:hypothetical protein